MAEIARDVENRAWLGRVTAGWKRPDLPLDVVRRYWRDVHSPAIARRMGLWEYRHYQFDAVRTNVLPTIADVDYACPEDAQLMWLSDVRYESEAGTDAFAKSPADRDVLSRLLGDIDLIVLRSTTYRAVKDNAWTYVDETGDPTPQGPPPHAQFGLFFRQRADSLSFRLGMRSLSEKWGSDPSVMRLRLALLDAPDAESERRAGYPIKSHPPDQQYQAWIDIVLRREADAARLVEIARENLRAHVRTLHAYPVAACYTSNYAGKPTLVGLRGYPAYDAIRSLGARNQLDPKLIAWMYGKDSPYT